MSSSSPRTSSGPRGAAEAGPGAVALRTVGTLVVALVLLLGVERLGAWAADPASPDWELAGRGVEYARSATLGGEPVHLLRVDPAKAKLRVLVGKQVAGSALTARDFAARTSALAAFNASFFDEAGEPMGLVVADGREVGSLRRTDWGVFSLGERGAAIVHTRDWRGGQAVEQAVQAGPRLVVGGVATRLKPQVAPRTALGVLPDGRVLVLASADFASLAADDLASTLARLGCREALNLDGGPSTQFYLSRGDGAAVHQPGGWPVPVAIGVYAEAAPAPTARCGCR